MTNDFQDEVSALVVAHPGHQARVHGWLAAARPQVFILTDGSGGAGRPRMDETTAYLKELGLSPAGIYGRYAERFVYERIVGRDFDFFVALADELAESFRRHGVTFVAGDAAEGYDAVHEVCRLVVDAAVRMVNAPGGERVANFDFTVVRPPDDCPAPLRERSIWLRLDEEAFSRKMKAARTYYPELFEEVRAAYEDEGGGHLQEYLGREYHGAGDAFGGLDVFRVECLRPVCEPWEHNFAPHEKPFYELRGERQVRAGRYAQVIRRREHLLPIAEALRRRIQ